MNVGRGLIIDTKHLFKNLPKEINSITILCENEEGRQVTFLMRNDSVTTPVPCPYVANSFFNSCKDEIDANL